MFGRGRAGYFSMFRRHNDCSSVAFLEKLFSDRHSEVRFLSHSSPRFNSHPPTSHPPPRGPPIFPSAIFKSPTTPRHPLFSCCVYLLCDFSPPLKTTTLRTCSALHCPPNPTRKKNLETPAFFVYYNTVFKRRRRMLHYYKKKMKICERKNLPPLRMRGKNIYVSWKKNNL